MILSADEWRRSLVVVCCLEQRPVRFHSITDDGEDGVEVPGRDANFIIEKLVPNGQLTSSREFMGIGRDKPTVKGQVG